MGQPFTMFKAEVDIEVFENNLYPDRVSGHAGTNIVTAETNIDLGIVNASVVENGGIQELDTR